METIIGVVIMIVCLLVVFAVLCCLEYFLARRESPWPGRALLILWAALSVLVFLWMVVNMANANNGLLNLFSGLELGLLLFAFAVLLAMNIPTALFALIYRFTRKKFSAERDMGKANR